jgi:15-cis-phytoene synthase
MDLTDPDRIIALAYAGKRRENLRILFALDQALGSLVSTVREPVLGQLKLAWWRDSLSEGATNPVNREPLLAAVQQLGLARELVGLVNGWEASLGELPLSNDALEAFANGRGGSLFAAAMQLYGVIPDDRSAGAGRTWALADFAFRCSDRETSRRALMLGGDASEAKGLPRPLGILTVLAQSDIARGDAHRWPPGSPRRLLRAFLFGLFGR